MPKRKRPRSSHRPPTKAEISKVMAALGRKGGAARAQNLSAAEIAAIGKRGAAIRYGRLPPQDQEPDST